MAVHITVRVATGVLAVAVVQMPKLAVQAYLVKDMLVVQQIMLTLNNQVVAVAQAQLAQMLLIQMLVMVVLAFLHL
jgi:hypothetical protein